MSDNTQETKETKETKAPVQPKPTKQTVEEMELEIKKLELDTKKLEFEEKKANVQDLRERLDERELKRETVRQRSITNGATLKSIAQNEAASQARCNHRKGGNGAHGVVLGQGDDSQYAVIKHMMQNGDMWVRCLRCGKTWKPPVTSEHATEAEFQAAKVEYQQAVNFQTRNVPSGSLAFKYSDGGQFFRESMSNTTLR